VNVPPRGIGRQSLEGCSPPGPSDHRAQPARRRRPGRRAFPASRNGPPTALVQFGRLHAELAVRLAAAATRAWPPCWKRCSTGPAIADARRRRGRRGRRRTASPTSRNSSPPHSSLTTTSPPARRFVRPRATPLPTTDPLGAFLETTALVADTDVWDPTSENGVALMTFHAAKGLEFPVVYLVAMEDGILPHERSLDHPEQLEEERRLVFVGITRGMQEVHASCLPDARLPRHAPHLGTEPVPHRNDRQRDGAHRCRRPRRWAFPGQAPVGSGATSMHRSPEMTNRTLTQPDCRSAAPRRFGRMASCWNWKTRTRRQGSKCGHDRGRRTRHPADAASMRRSGGRPTSQAGWVACRRSSEPTRSDSGYGTPSTARAASRESAAPAPAPSAS
jgi:hypothetical protein